MTIKLSQFRDAVNSNYLPSSFAQLVRNGDRLTVTEGGKIALLSQCIETDNGETYHEEQDRDDYVYDELNDCYINTDVSIEVYGRNGNTYTTEEGTNDVVEFRGDLYLVRYLSDNGLLYDGDDEVIHEDDAVFCVDTDCYYHSDDANYDDNSGEWYRFENNLPDRGLLWDYDNGPRERDYSVTDHKGGGAIFGIGMEIEKGELPAFPFDKQDVYDSTGCVLERDGSVSNGFELKTAVYNLHSKKTDERLEQIRKFADVENTEGAGGHIGFSCSGLSDIQLLNEVRGFLPLIYAMHSKRIGNSYCIAKKTDDLIADGDKMQSIRLRGNYIEFRIFSAVKNFNSVLFRLNLFRIMSVNLGRSFTDVIDLCLNPHSKLHKLLRADVYSNPAKFVKLIRKSIELNSVFGNEVLTPEKLRKIEIKLNNLNK